MKLYSISLAVATVTIASVSFARPVDSARLLVPGKQVGGIHIGADDSTLNKLGKPDDGDGAMGRFTSTYYAKTSPRYRLDVYSHRVFPKSGKDHVIIDTVRVESPYFQTGTGIRANSPRKTIKAQYPQLKPITRFEPVKSSDPRRCTLYDDVTHGIGFEVLDGDLDTGAVYVHKPGERAQPLGHDGTAWKQVDL